MNASSPFFSAGLERYDQQPVLIAASSKFAAMQAVEVAQQAKFPVIAIPIENALERLGQQGQASAFWLEVESDSGKDLDRLLDRLDAEVGTGRFPAIISAPAALVDAITARIEHPAIELLFDASPMDRAAALALVTARSIREREAVNEDISGEPSAARLRQLSDEVSRIAATLARLSVGPGAAPAEKPEAPKGEAPAVSLDTV